MQQRLRIKLLTTAALVIGACSARSQPLNFTTPGAVSSYTVPANGYYSLRVTGADGGDGGNSGDGGAQAGTGATVTGIYYLSAGDQLDFMIGAHGDEGGYLGGGGGGTGVVLNATHVLLVAGAGGGGSAGASTGYGGQGMVTTSQGGAALGDAGGGGGFSVNGLTSTCAGSGGQAATLTAIGAGGITCTGRNGGAGFGGGGAGGSFVTHTTTPGSGGGGGYAGGPAGTRGGGGYSFYNYTIGGAHFDVTPGVDGGSGFASDLDGTASITPVPLYADAITGNPFIPGASLTIPFTTGQAFTSGNVFTAQLSDATGSFAAPVSIGTLSATGSGSILATLPPALPNGSGYRVRIVASTPAATSLPSITQLTITEPGNALELRGTGDYVISGSNVGISGTQPRTLEYFGTLSRGYEHQANWGIASKNQAFGTFTFGNYLYFYAHDASDDFNTGYQTDDQPHHVAVSYDGTHVRVYVDGILTSAGAVARTLATTNTQLVVGDRMDGIAPFTGVMDEVRVWNRALCQEEIQHNMNKILPSPATQNGLKIYYRFNQGLPGGANTGITAAYDSSASANHGSLVNVVRSGTSSNFVTAPFINAVAATFATPLPAVTTTSTQPVSGNTEFKTTCYVLTNLTPSGTTPVSGSVTAKVSLDGTIQSYLGHAYVQRHYDITPAVNPNAATGFVTLYFTQSEFTAYNAANGVDPDVPANPGDVAGMGRLRVTQFHGTSATSVPGSYSGYTGTEPAVMTIKPTSVSWNATASRWEVSFPVNGFSGFFVGGRGLPGAVSLPVHLTAFDATREGVRNRLSWTVATEDAGTSYGIERSTDGKTFTRIAAMDGRGDGSAYVYVDAAPGASTNYYRLQIRDADGAHYSRTVALGGGATLPANVQVSPVPAHNSLRIVSQDAGLTGQPAVILDMQGREMQRFLLQPAQELDLQAWPAGVYSLRLGNGSVIRIVKQ